MPRYSALFSQRKSLAQKLGSQLATCFCNLETFLNLEFESGKQASESRGGSENVLEEDSNEGSDEMQQSCAKAQERKHIDYSERKGHVSYDSAREEQASPHSMDSLQVSTIKPDQSSTS